MQYIELKKLRKSRKMTQEQVGILAGMSKSQVSRMEKGTLGSPETYKRVLDALGYKLVFQVEDIRKDNQLSRDLILSLLKVYYLGNAKRMGIERIGLFGSFARNEAGPNSDIDILVALKKPDLFLYSQMSQQLETVFGRHVDIVSAKARLSESFQKQVNKDIVYVSE
ncbi:MAG: nucleotidyltransferase domain-containing protein [Bacteroidales bacterium]|nr:nucleotidyltransferase domain-containing protein [Bacteroidales bacterium]